MILNIKLIKCVLKWVIKNGDRTVVLDINNILSILTLKKYLLLEMHKLNKKYLLQKKHLLNT